MIAPTRNLKIFVILLTIYTVLFKYFLSYLLTQESYTLVWVLTGVYGILIFVTAWPLGASDSVRKSRVNLPFHYHIVTYCVCVTIAFIWQLSGMTSKCESMIDVVLMAIIWGAFLIGHYFFSRKTIKGMVKDKIFE